MSGGQKIIDGLNEAIRGDFASVVIDGQVWVKEPAWQPIGTAPKDETIILANFTNRCLLTGSPHVWTATYVTQWQNLDNERVSEDPMWCECSFAATNENGEPTHWMPLPEPPKPA